MKINIPLLFALTFGCIVTVQASTMRTDSLGNTYVTDDNGNQTSYRTDSLGNTYGSDGSMSRTDSLGNTYVTDGNGNQTQYRTDSLGVGSG